MLLYFPRIAYACPTNTDVRENFCFWDQRTSVVYRQPYADYIFIFNAENPFGNLTQKVRFHHYANGKYFLFHSVKKEECF